MKIVYSCPFVPAEWIKAHGLLPSRISADLHNSRPAPEPGMCPYAHAFAASAASDKNAVGLVLTTTCDQMRRVYDIIIENTTQPVFLMHIPHTWQSIEAQRLYLSELHRLGRFLVELGGSSPTPDVLRQTMVEYDNARAEIRGMQGSLSPRKWAEFLAYFNRSGKLEYPGYKDENLPSGVLLALLGGPVPADSFEIYDFIEAAGGYIALDATETGERTMPAPFNRRLLNEDPISALADSYFGTIPDVFRRPNSGLFSWLKVKLVERGIRGIVLRRYLWCDKWNAEAYRLKEWSGMPLIHIDVNGEGTDTVRNSSRLQSFLETLE